MARDARREEKETHDALMCVALPRFASWAKTGKLSHMASSPGYWLDFRSEHVWRYKRESCGKEKYVEPFRNICDCQTFQS